MILIIVTMARLCRLRWMEQQQQQQQQQQQRLNTKNDQK
jgi:hypothetical protein